MTLKVEQMFSTVNQTISNVLGFQRPTAQGLFEKALFASGPDLPKSPRILSGYSVGNACVVSDYTSLYRSVQDLSVGLWDRFPGSPLSFLKEFASSKDISLGYHAFGSTASLNVVMGIAQLVEACRSSAYAKAIGDDQGLLQGRVSSIQAASLFGAGVSFAVFRPLSMIKIVNDSPSTSLIGRLSSASVQSGIWGD